MAAVLTVAESYGVSPFEILKQDIDDFIMVVKALMRRGASSAPKGGRKKAAPAKEGRVRVTEKTATGGWF